MFITTYYPTFIFICGQIFPAYINVFIYFSRAAWSDIGYLLYYPFGYDAVARLCNTNGTTFLELYPSTHEGLSWRLNRIYENILFDLVFLLGDALYYEIETESLSLAVGSERYIEEFAKHIDNWINSGVYKQKIAEAFKEGDEYQNYNSTQPFEEFMENIYDEFGFEKSFNDTFLVLYNQTYGTLLHHGYIAVGSIDPVSITMDYMR